MKKSLYLGACALSLLATEAVAQETQDKRAGWTPESAPDIIVTGTRDDYTVTGAQTLRSPVPLFETPQSVQVLTRKLLEDQQLNSLDEALSNVSGVIPSLASEIVLANPVVRGFEAEVFTDGLIGYGDTAVSDPGSLWNVQQIEVAKGPTTVLYGGGTGAPVGGLINLVSKKPSGTEQFAFQLRAGSFDNYSVAVDADLPLGGGLSARFVAQQQTFGDNIDEVEGERILAAQSLRYNPDDATDIVARYTYSRVQQLEYAGLPAFLVGNPAVRSNRFTGATDTPQTDIENQSFDLDARQRLAPGITANVRARRYTNDFDEFSTSPFFAFFPCSGTVCPLLNGVLTASVREWTVDGSLTAEFTTGGIEHVLIGGAQWDRTNYRGGTGFDLGNPVLFDYADPASDFAFQLPDITTRIANRYRTFAVYAQDQVTIGARLHILASLRYSRLSLRETEGGAGNDDVFHEWNPRIGTSFDLAEGISLFAGYATGSRLSLFFNGTDAPVPERSQSVEAGVKFALAGIGLSGTIAAFQIERTNVPTPDPATFFTSIQTGKERSRGAELDLIYEPSKSLSLLASYAFTDAEVLEDTVIPQGDTLPRVPRNRGRIAARYRFSEGALQGFELGGGLTYSSRTFIALPNGQDVAGYIITDAQASYAIGGVTLGLRVDNLFNEDYFLPYQFFAQDVVRPGNPRSAFVTLGFEF